MDNQRPCLHDGMQYCRYRPFWNIVTAIFKIGTFWTELFGENNWPVQSDFLLVQLIVPKQTACLVVNPITVGNFAFLFNCTPVGRTSDSVMVPT